MAEPLIVIGNGMAAARFAEELASRALGGNALAVIGDEPHLVYNRVLLSSVLAKESSADGIALKSAASWRDRGVTLRYGCAARSVDVAARTVTLADGGTFAFSKLVLNNWLAAHLASLARFRSSRCRCLSRIDDVARGKAAPVRLLRRAEPLIGNSMNRSSAHQNTDTPP